MLIGNPPTYLGIDKLQAKGLNVCIIPARKTNPRYSKKTGSVTYTQTLHPSLNEWTRGDPFRIAAIKEGWEEWYQEILLENDFPKIKGAPVYCFMIYFFPDNSPRDYDNYAPKFLLDALKKYGAIQDDSDRVLGAHPFIVHRSCPAMPHIFLALTADRAVYRQVIDEFLTPAEGIV